MYGTTMSGTQTDATPNAMTLECILCHDSNLQAHHPVSILYNENVASLRPVSTPLSGWTNATILADILQSGKVECVSCHIAHPDTVLDASGLEYLRTANRPQLCLGCHDK